MSGSTHIHASIHHLVMTCALSSDQDRDDKHGQGHRSQRENHGAVCQPHQRPVHRPEVNSTQPHQPPVLTLFPLLYMHRMKANLQYCAEMIPTLSTQLRIIASVKASTPTDTSVSLLHCHLSTSGRLVLHYIQADVMLVKNAQNLMEAVIKTMKAAEAACMKVCVLLWHQKQIKLSPQVSKYLLPCSLLLPGSKGSKRQSSEGGS